MTEQPDGKKERERKGEDRNVAKKPYRVVILNSANINSDKNNDNKENLFIKIY